MVQAALFGAVQGLICSLYVPIYRGSGQAGAVSVQGRAGRVLTSSIGWTHGALTRVRATPGSLLLAPSEGRVNLLRNFVLLAARIWENAGDWAVSRSRRLPRSCDPLDAGRSPAGHGVDRSDSMPPLKKKGVSGAGAQIRGQSGNCPLV